MVNRRAVERGPVSSDEVKYFAVSGGELKIPVSSVDLVKLLYL